MLQPKPTTHPHDSAMRGDMPGDRPGDRTGDPRPARAVAPQAVAPQAVAPQTVAPQAVGAAPGHAPQRIAEDGKPAGVGKLYAILGMSGSITLVVGAVLAVACTAWALTLDVPRQVAYLAGYITVAASACICAALVAVRHATARAAAPQAAPATIATLAPKAAIPPAPIAAVTAARKPVAKPEAKPEAKAEPEPTAEKKPDQKAEPKAEKKPEQKAEPKLEAQPEPKADTQPDAAPAAQPVAETPAVAKSTEPDYDAWNGVVALRVADASRLWCGIEPGRPVNPDVMERARAILAAIEQGELPKGESTGVLAQYKIGWHTEVRRDALKAWAGSKGDTPRFLRD